MLAPFVGGCDAKPDMFFRAHIRIACDNARQVPACEDHKRDGDVRLRAQFAQHQRKDSGDGVDKQDVAPPEQEEVQGAEKHQPAQPPKLHHFPVPACLFRPIEEQGHAGAEQPGEQRAHLAYKDDEAQRKGDFVGQCAG